MINHTVTQVSCGCWDCSKLTMCLIQFKTFHWALDQALYPQSNQRDKKESGNKVNKKQHTSNLEYVSNKHFNKKAIPFIIKNNVFWLPFNTFFETGMSIRYNKKLHY